jgi:dipeptidyl aminopeptidase/acylaminoacyl peptidase
MPRTSFRPRPRKAATKARRSDRTAAKRLIAPEDLLRFRLLSDPQIAPDGREIVYVHKQASAKKKGEYDLSLWIAPASSERSARSDGAVPRQFTTGTKDSRPRFSPDGAQIAFISERTRHVPQLCLIPRNGGEARELTKLPPGSLGDFKWAPNGTFIAMSFRPTADEWTEEAKKERETSGASTPPRVIDDWWYRLDGDGYFIAQRYALHIIDVETGAHSVVYNKDTLGMFSFDISPDSKTIVVATNRSRNALIDPTRDELLLVNVASGKVTALPGSSVPKGPKTSPLFSRDGKLIAFAGREGKDGTYSTENLELWVYDVAKKKARSLTGDIDICQMAACLSDTAEVSFEPQIRWARDGKRIYFRLGWHGEQHLASVPARGGAIKRHTHGAIDISLGNLSDDGKRMAVTVAQWDSPPEVNVAELGPEMAKRRQVTNANAALLGELDLAPLEEHWVTSTDGVKVQTWIARPPRLKRGKRVPAILEVHGGPHAQYGVGFFHEFQVLAAQGYAVFFSNPRGGKGYGRDFCAAIRGAWGTKDWEDVQAVTTFMQQQKFVNPKRIGIMGGSYGGYMTNWAIGHSRDYKAAITDRCVSNLHSMMGSSDFPDKPDLYWEGNTWDRPEKLWEQSPLKYFGNVRTPTLIVHSEGDLRCNIEQAEQVFVALRLQNVPTRFVRYPSTTSHGMSRGGPPDLRIHRLHQIVEWWRKYL